MTDIVSGNSVILAIVTSYLIQHLKDSPAKALQWLSSEHPKVVRGFSAMLAALTAIGITFQFSGGVLTISGLTAENLVQLAATGISQFILQDSAFRVLISTPRKLR